MLEFIQQSDWRSPDLFVLVAKQTRPSVFEGVWLYLLMRRLIVIREQGRIKSMCGRGILGFPIVIL